MPEVIELLSSDDEAEELAACEICCRRMPQAELAEHLPLHAFEDGDGDLVAMQQQQEEQQALRCTHPGCGAQFAYADLAEYESHALAHR